MKTRYIILVLSIIFLSFLFISLNAQTITNNQILNLGGKTFSPLKKDNSYYYNQSVFLTQEGKHKLIVGDKPLSIDKIIVTPNTDKEDIPVITGIEDVSPIEDIPDEQIDNLPPSSIVVDTVYGDVGYTPGFDAVEYFNNYKQGTNTDVSTVANIWGTPPLTGNYHIPVLLVKFADFPNTLPSSVFQDQFNSNFYLDGNGTSVKKYFYKESYGNLNITYDIYEWKTLSAHTYAWYGTGNNAFQFILDTMNLFGTGSNAIDFTQYDYDNDGRIDGIIMLHAGYAQEYAGTGNMKSQTRIFNQSTSYSIQGKYYGNVSIVDEKLPASFCNPYIIEYNYPTDCRGPVLTDVHEFTHVLGLPDLYQINPNTGAQVGAGLGDITMMAQQDKYPQKPINLDAWSRYFFGWITPTTITSTMSNNYNIYSIDTNPNAYILKDETKMNAREYFIVTNRHVYQSPNNQDKWLFGGPVSGLTTQGGLDIYHVDEAYIESQYPTNSVMYDSDMNMYNDTVSHPGIVFEQNALTDGSNDQDLSYGDLYTNEFNLVFNDPTWGSFDNIARLSPPNSIFWDTTSKTYNGLQDTGVKVQALSGSGSFVTAYLQSQAGPFNAHITNPKNNHAYKNTNVINFTENHNNNTGNVSCVWKKTGDVVISNTCSFSASPHSFGIDSTGCSPNTTPITLIATDSGTGIQVTDVVNIKVYVKFMCERASGPGFRLPD